MARAAAESGIARIAATPHLRSDFPGVRVEEIATRCEALQSALKAAAIPLEVISGAEVSIGWALEASDEELRLASYGQLGRDLLVESPLAPTANFERFLYLLRGRGYRLILAHPERCPSFHRNQDAVRLLVQQGVLLQLNAESFLGNSGAGVRRLARRLLAEGLGHVIASDGHRGHSWRPVTRLAEAVNAAGKLIGTERAEWMARAAPTAITTGRPLPEPPVMTRPATRWRPSKLL